MTECKREICDEKLTDNDNSWHREFCSYECQKYHKQETCKHTLRLEGIKLGETNYGMETKTPVYFCPECELDWEKS